MIAAVVVLSVALGLSSAWCVSTFTGVLRRRHKRPVLVTLKSGDAFRGVLADSDRHALVVRDAQTFGEDGRPLGVDGEVIVLTGDIKYVQRL